ncbi:hypothetical protein [Egbenema bharatensis]|uniref:hypothetical protein n=1 Tax=Egbenema bharatensis TaxID=3463334 RepID=UPI003A83E6E9
MLNEETVRLIKAIAGVSSRSVSSLIQEAVDKLLAEENMQNLIEHHRLDEELDLESGDPGS